MRHKIAGNRLNRSRSLRKATLRDMAKATLIEERICTTKAKAKEARKLVDKLITLGKNGTLSDRRRAFAILCDHGLVSRLFEETSSRFKKRTGGYTRIVSLGERRGDHAQLVMLELTEKKEIIISQPKSEAAAKKETLKTVPSQEKGVKPEHKPQPAKAPSAQEPGVLVITEIKEPPKKETLRVEPKIPWQEKIKKPRSFVGGLRKMFNRKVGGGN